MLVKFNNKCALLTSDAPAVLDALASSYINRSRLNINRTLQYVKQVHNHITKYRITLFMEWNQCTIIVGSYSF